MAAQKGAATPSSKPIKSNSDVPTHVAGWVVALVAFAVAIAGATWWTIDRGQDQNPSWLFSHTASGGTLLKQSNGDYTLTLTDIDPHVMAFTDRPVRDSVIMPATDFITAWPTYFASSPPNAVLVEHNAKGNTDSVVLTLTNPRLATPAAANSTSADTATLTFDAKLITTEHPSNLKRLTRGIHKTPSTNFTNASLFIDDVMTDSQDLSYSQTWECIIDDDTFISDTQTFQFPGDLAQEKQFMVWFNDCVAGGGRPIQG